MYYFSWSSSYNYRQSGCLNFHLKGDKIYLWGRGRVKNPVKFMTFVKLALPLPSGNCDINECDKKSTLIIGLNVETVTLTCTPNIKDGKFPDWVMDPPDALEHITCKRLEKRLFPKQYKVPTLGQKPVSIIYFIGTQSSNKQPTHY